MASSCFISVILCWSWSDGESLIRATVRWSWPFSVAIWIAESPLAKRASMRSRLAPFMFGQTLCTFLLTGVAGFGPGFITARSTSLTGVVQERNEGRDSAVQSERFYGPCGAYRL